MIKKIILLTLLISMTGIGMAGCAWSPLQVNVPISWPDSHFQAEQIQENNLV